MLNRFDFSMRPLFLLLFCSTLPFYAIGQFIRADSIDINDASRVAIGRYKQESSTDERLFNGAEYIGYDIRIKIHPYFESDSSQTGQVQYEGTLFSVPMLYDIVKDVLVIVHTSGRRMTVQNSHVASFSFLNHQFIRVDSTNGDLKQGFYDVLYNGPTQLLARRTKSILINPSANFEYGQFLSKTTYFIRKNGQYIQVKNKKTVLTALEDRKKQLVTYARKQKIKFGQTTETAILQLTRQYDELARTL